MADLLKLYHAFPYPLRDIFASIRGYQLSFWRYGRNFEEKVQEVFERESWTKGKWETWTAEKLAEILHIAAKSVPYYRDQWTSRRKKGDYRSWEYLENWPILKKETIRENPRAFLSESKTKTWMRVEHTSGSTGTPLLLWQSIQTLRDHYAIFEARVRRWNGISREDKWGIFGGQLVVPYKTSKPPYWVWNQAFNQLYFSSYHLKPETIEIYLNAIKKYELDYILAYPSALSYLAASVIDQDLSAPPLKVAISNAEPLFDYQKTLIRRVFDCKFTNTYGMSELVAGASECSEGSMHIWPEEGIIEVFSDNEDILLNSNQIGRFICTGLMNRDMPLIRYEVGDRGCLSDKKCKCQIELPIIASIEGRNDDVVITPDGRRIGRLDPIFKSDFPIVESQIIQESSNLIHVKIVPGKEYDHNKELLSQLHKYLGDMEIIIDLVATIPRGPNGKFKSVINKLIIEN